MSRRAVAWIVGLSCIAIAAAVSLRVFEDRPAANARRVESRRENPSTIAPVSGQPAIDVAVSSDEAPKAIDQRPLEERFALPTQSAQLPVSKIANAKYEESRQFFWNYLRAFADKAELTEGEWQRFLGDISDVATSEITAQSTAEEELAGSTPKQQRASLDDAARLTRELAVELEERCASWMTEKQMAAFRLRLNAMAVISMTQQLKELTSAAAVLSDARR